MNPSTYADFAKHLGISSVAVGQWVRRNPSVKTPDGRIDLDHPLALKYRAKHERLKARRAAGEKLPQGRPKSDPRDTLEKGDIASLMDEWPPETGAMATEEFQQAQAMLEPLITKYHSLTGMKDWVDLAKKLEDLVEKRLKNEETLGAIVPREFVRVHVIALLDGMNRRMLRDAPKTLAHRLYAMKGSDVPVEEAEKVVREILASNIQSVKSKVTKSIK